MNFYGTLDINEISKERILPRKHIKNSISINFNDEKGTGIFEILKN